MTRDSPPERAHCYESVVRETRDSPPERAHCYESEESVARGSPEAERRASYYELELRVTRGSVFGCHRRPRCEGSRGNQQTGSPFHMASWLWGYATSDRCHDVPQGPHGV